MQRKAIDLHQKYILHLEAVKAKSKSTLDSMSANFLVAPATANDMDMDDDLGVALDDSEDFGTSMTENPPDMLGTDVEMPNDPNEPHLSDEVREHLAETRKEILSITQQ